MKKAVTKPFQLHGGHPALDLVNTLDMRFTGENIELLPTYAELLRFTAQAEVLTAEQARSLSRTHPAQGQRVLAATRELREALASVLYAWADGSKPPAAQIALLERHFQAAAQHRKLRMDGTHLDWTWGGSGNGIDPELPLWKLAQAASDLLTSNLTDSIKDCGDPTCRWLFLDVSKNHTRRWCNMKTCGNRMKARRFQARRQDAAL